MAVIGLNAQLLNLSASYRGAGIHRYIHQTLVNLPAVAPRHRFRVYLNDRQMQSPDPAMQLRRTRFPAQKPLPRIVWEQFALAAATYRDRLDLLHAMAFARPLVSHCPVVLTIYDMSFMRMPERFPAFQRAYLRLMTRWSARHAARIIVISQSTRNDVVHYCGVPAERVRVVYCAADAAFRPAARAAVEEFRTRNGLPAHFILYLGTLEPRKNVPALVRAYAQMRRRNGAGDAPKLVIAGAKGWGYDDVFAAAEQSGVRDDVIFAGFVPQDELPLWYNAADVFVYPSLYEGFGLPVLEAMACGTPAITSSVSSLPEVAGDAALTIAPDDSAALSDAMASALHDSGLRAGMRERGLRQASRFDWRTAALETARIYDEALAGTAPAADQR
ncbi:MAG: glycosyltransferase family 4 protein [Chloroflexi bacterium]|nr:glycosyltransferase family 4 protein [Chloroflexota bacterium]